MGNGWKPEATRLTKIQPIETFVEYESATNFKSFEAIHNIVLDIDDQLFCFGVLTEVGHMNDELRRSFETFQQTDIECQA